MSSQRSIEFSTSSGTSESSTSKKPSTRTSSSFVGAQAGIRSRFITTVGVLLTMGFLTLIAHRLLTADSTVFRLVGATFVLLLGFFGHEWCWTHARGLTRERRAHFDELNILETYQPRARTHGHLFVPDPPTPGVTIQEGDAPQRSADEQKSWNANRDAHYKDMFAYAQRVAKEQEVMEKATPVPIELPANKEPKTAIPADKAESSTKTAILKATSPPAMKVEQKQGVDIAKAPIDLEVTARADTNEQDEPLYENITPMEQELPRPPRPPVTEQITNVATMVARTVSSKVRTALDNTSLRGALPGGSSDSKSTWTALSRTPPPESPKNDATNKSKRG